VKERKDRERGQRGLPFGETIFDKLEGYAADLQKLGDIAEDSPADVNAKAALYRKVYQSPESERAHRAADLWTAAFFAPLKDTSDPSVPTHEFMLDFLERPLGMRPPLVKADELKLKHHFFHWPLEFPEVFTRGGFDVVLGNPPWERIKLQEEEFFGSRDGEIAQARNKAARQILISQLPQKNPGLANEFCEAKRAAEATSKFVRHGKRFPLAAIGDINTYALFSELARNLLNLAGRPGIVVPTAIATADTTKVLFDAVASGGSLVSLLDFQEARDFFTGLESRDPFCLLTIRAGQPNQSVPAKFVFQMLALGELSNKIRQIYLTPVDFALVNPNTRTCPVFRTGPDAELTKKIYRSVPVLINERADQNTWGVRFLRMFDMATDSGLFETTAGVGLLPLYEAKMVHQFDHRWATYDGDEARHCTLAEKVEPGFAVHPQYWVPEKRVKARLEELSNDDEKLVRRWDRKWLLGFRDIARSNDERTAIFSLMPCVAVGHKIPMVLPEAPDLMHASGFLANVNSLVFDYVLRQKIGAASVSYFILKQLPVISPIAYTSSDFEFITPRVLELVYSAWDIKGFADDLWRDSDENLQLFIRRQWENNQSATGGHDWNPPERVQIAKDGIPLPPFKWEDDRRASLRAELDGYYAHLYGLTRHELRYIIDPKDLYGPDFPSETFRVLKQKEERLYGEYRTRRLVLEAFDKLAESPLLLALSGPVPSFVNGINADELVESQLQLPLGGSALKQCLDDGLHNAFAVDRNRNADSQGTVYLACLADEHFEHDAVDGIVSTKEQHGRDDGCRLPKAVNAPLALLKAVGIPGKVVVNDSVETVLEVDSLAEAVGGHQDATGALHQFRHARFTLLVIARFTGDAEGVDVGELWLEALR
jgi:hypothetical protein